MIYDVCYDVWCVYDMIYDVFLGKLQKIYHKLTDSEITAACFDHGGGKLIVGDHKVRHQNTDHKSHHITSQNTSYNIIKYHQHIIKHITTSKIHHKTSKTEHVSHHKTYHITSKPIQIHHITS